jgi:protease IV
MIILKRIWRWLVALKDGLALVALLIFFAGLFMILSGSSNPMSERDGALLLDLDGVIVEQVEQADPLKLIQGDVPSFAQYRGSDIIRALNLAAKDDDIKTVVLNLDGFMGGGQVLLEDVARAIDAVRAAKKPVLTYATGYGDDSYLLASHASEVWLNPMGAVLLAGPGGTRPYFKGLIDRLGVNVHVYRVGKYKSFVEPYIRDSQSDEARAANQALVGSLWSEWQSHVKKARPQANIAPLLTDPAAAAKGQGLAETALSLKLVDKLASETAFGKRVATLVGSDEDEGPGDYNRSTLETYLAANPDRSSGDGVGIITVAGEIVDGEAGSGTAGGDSIERQVHQALTNDDVKALVVRVDSPGGSALASEQIRLALAEAKTKKLPVIVSMGNVAASGGYWVAMAGEKVFAEPSTITGSIGVFGIVPTFENSLARYGVKSDGVQTTPLSGQPDVLGGTNAITDTLLQAGVEDIYGKFLSLVATARKLPIDKVAENAQGRVWDGGTARQLGLVDTFGSLDDAVAEAAKRAGLETANVRRIEVEAGQGFLSWLLSGLGVHATFDTPRDLMSQMMAKSQAQTAAGLRDGLRVMTGPAVQVRCMACPAPAASARVSDQPKSLMIRMLK